MIRVLKEQKISDNRQILIENHENDSEFTTHRLIINWQIRPIVYAYVAPITKALKLISLLFTSRRRNEWICSSNPL